MLRRRPVPLRDLEVICHRSPKQDRRIGALARIRPTILSERMILQAPPLIVPPAEGTTVGKRVATPLAPFRRVSRRFRCGKDVPQRSGAARRYRPTPSMPAASFQFITFRVHIFQIASESILMVIVHDQRGVKQQPAYADGEEMLRRKEACAIKRKMRDAPCVLRAAVRRGMQKRAWCA